VVDGGQKPRLIDPEIAGDEFPRKGDRLGFEVIAEAEIPQHFEEGVMAQRLVRRLCPECREAYHPEHCDLPEDFPVESLQGPLYRPTGCEQCRGTGYRGRMGLYELLVTNEKIRDLATQRAASNLIKQAAMESGMQTLREDGWEKVLQGLTTVDEVLRVTKAD
jgi:general secretion pathway protein E/type IV pilus assembly protein PilB